MRSALEVTCSFHKPVEEEQPGHTDSQPANSVAHSPLHSTIQTQKVQITGAVETSNTEGNQDSYQKSGTKVNPESTFKSKGTKGVLESTYKSSAYESQKIELQVKPVSAKKQIKATLDPKFIDQTYK